MKSLSTLGKVLDPMSNGAQSVEVLPGCMAIPIDGSAKAGMLQLCVLTRAGVPVLLRDQLDARVFLGCVTDAAGVVQRWVECWVQDSSGLTGVAPSYRRVISNTTSNQRWTQIFEGFDALDGDALIRTGFEKTNPPPMFWDAAKHLFITPVDPATGRGWDLCTDDAKLTAFSLPAYTTSLHRFLHLTDGGGSDKFVQVAPIEPVEEPSAAVAEFAKSAGLTPAFNPGAGRLLVRDFSAIEFEDFIDLLADGKAPEPTLEQDPSGQWKTIQKVFEERSPDGRLLLWHRGHKARLIENLHLRLRLLTDAVRSVRQWVARMQRPMLNLHAGSFSIRLGNPGAGLPLLWTGSSVLRVPGDAMQLRVPHSDFSFFLPSGLVSSAVYAPQFNAGSGGQAVARIVSVRSGKDGMTALDLKLMTQERIDTSPNDLVWLRMTVTGHRLEFYATPQIDASLAMGEFRLRSIEQPLPAEVVAVLNAQAGAMIRNVYFEMIPLISTPCDLFSLGVLGIRTLLVNGQASLPEALDRIISLSQHLTQQMAQRKLAEPSQVDATDVAVLFAAEKQWYDWLGAHHLTHEELTPEQAFDVVPVKLWYDVILTLARMLSGVSGVSECQNLGAAPSGAIHRVFDRTIEQLESLLHRTRSLLLVDWHQNREVSRVIRGAIGKASGNTGRAANLR